MLSACHKEDPKPTKDLENLKLTAVNLTVDNGKLTARSGEPSITVTTTVNTSVNGMLSTVSVTKKSNELPVRVGDVVEITFTPSCIEETEATFTFPDGMVKTLTSTETSYQWTVPVNFTFGSQINGESHYETSEVFYNQTGAITLIELE